MPLQIQKFERASITHGMIAEAAELFSQNYGLWGPLAVEKMTSKRFKQGNRIKLSPQKLITELLPPGSDTVYVCALDITDERQSTLIGNLFATRWNYKGQPIIWISQLCVRLASRSQGIATKLVNALHGEGELGLGILSSHPHAILTVLHAYGRPAEGAKLTMTRELAPAVMKSCPVKYVREASVHGSLFGEEGGESVSSADTQFWVDHEEPLRALDSVRNRGIRWPFGELPDGHEYLLLAAAKGQGRRLDLQPIHSQS